MVHTYLARPLRFFEHVKGDLHLADVEPGIEAFVRKFGRTLEHRHQIAGVHIVGDEREQVRETFQRHQGSGATHAERDTAPRLFEGTRREHVHGSRLSCGGLGYPVSTGAFASKNRSMLMKTGRKDNNRDNDATPRVTSSRQASYTVPGLTMDAGKRVSDTLQERLASMVDLSLTLKHIHWNVVGANFIGVHQMLDPQFAGTLTMIDDLAERIAALGGVPSGLPGRLTKARAWDDYSLDRADSLAHLGALDVVYSGVIKAHRVAMESMAVDDRVSEDVLIGQDAVLERYQWFVRSHLADWAGGMANAGSRSEIGAAKAVAAKQKVTSSAAKRSVRRAS